jgi:RNA polymerase sigma-70 factor (ECF subfamily)
MSRREAGTGNASARAELALRVARAQAGGRQELDRLLRDHQEPLYRHIRAITKDRETAFDALQNCLLLIARRLSGLRDPRWFKAWAYRIATREAVRMAKRETRIRDLREAAALVQPVEAPVPEAPFDAALLRACADRLAELPPACQIVVRLHYFEEMTFVEIAEALEIPVGTAKSRLAYGLALLRRQIASSPPQGRGVIA